MATIRDFKLDDSGELAIEDGDFVLVEDGDVVAQMLRIKLRHFLGEWDLDTSFGVPWFENVFDPPTRRKPQRSLVESTIRNAILEVPHVRKLLTFDADFDAQTRTMTVDFEVDTDFGTVSESVTVP